MRLKTTLLLLSVITIIVILFYFKAYKSFEIEIPDQDDIVIGVLNMLDSDDYKIDMDCDEVSAGSIAMPTGNVPDGVARIIVELLGVNSSMLFLDSNLVCEFDMNELEQFELIVALEHHFMTEISDLFISTFYTPENILIYLKENDINKFYLYPLY